MRRVIGIISAVILGVILLGIIIVLIIDSPLEFLISVAIVLAMVGLVMLVEWGFSS